MVLMEGIHCGVIFPLERRYNMCQETLPFVVSQEDTFIMDDCNDVSMECPKEAHRKRKFEMHQIFNVDKGDEAHGWCDMMRRDTGKIISQVENICTMIALKSSGTQRRG